MILRALLLGLLNAIRRLFHLPNTADKRPAHGPAHPRIRAARIATTIPAIPERALARPARPPLPPHLAALLAAAPVVEPELAPRPRPQLLQTFRSIAAHVRVYNPKPPTPDLRRPEPEVGGPWAQRLASAVSRFGSLLARDGPPRAPTLG